MTPLTQTKILRALQGQEFERVGGNEPIKADVRVIAATNRDLEKMVGEGTFRGDLYYRLNVFTIRLPPLRERREDIPRLAEHFVNRFSRELRKNVQSIADESLVLLKRYTWPGNVREFQSVIKQALLQATGPVLLPDFLPESVRRRSAITPAMPSSDLDLGALSSFIQEQLRADSTSLYADYQALTDRHLLTLVLAHTSGNLSQAARILGITRATLRAKLQALGLSVEKMPTASREDEK
jgi:two-component system nitrogen regulation response regulator GlnG